MAGGADTITKMAITLIDLKQFQDAIKYLEIVASISSDIAFLKGRFKQVKVCLLRIKKAQCATAGGIGSWRTRGGNRTIGVVVGWWDEKDRFGNDSGDAIYHN